MAHVASLGRFYRLAAMVGHDRQIWHQRLVKPPIDFPRRMLSGTVVPDGDAGCLKNGLICFHCNGTAVPLDLEDESLRKGWLNGLKIIQAYGVAHWDETRRNSHVNYEQAFEDAAQQSEQLLAYQGVELAPALVEFFPAVIWEDQDECLR